MTNQIDLTEPDLQIFLRFLTAPDAPAVLAFYTENRQFLKEWEPARSNHFFTIEHIKSLVEGTLETARLDQSYSFGIFLKAQPERLIGRINLANIVRGISHSANLGYALAQEYNGRGYATDAVRLMLSFAFQELDLHRVGAATLLHNYGSMRVLEKNRFRREGLALRYLQINGRWQDHYLFALTAEEL